MTPTKPTTNTWLTLTWPESDWTVEVAGRYYPGDPGQTFGPPERCWPPEPPELDLHSAIFTSPDGQTKFDVCLLPPGMLSDGFWGKLAQIAFEAIPDASHSEEPEPDYDEGYDPYLGSYSDDC